MARIEALESQLARMEAALSRLTTIVDKKTTTPGKPGADGTNGRNGTDGKDGRTGPIRIRIIAVDDAGSRTVVREKDVYPGGKPLDLIFHEKFLREEQ